MFSLYLILLYLLEAMVGSSVDVYNAELGYEAGCEKTTRLSNRQFFTQLLPFIFLSIGVPLLLSVILRES